MVQKGIVKEWYVSKQTIFVAYDIFLNVHHHKSIQYATENISHINLKIISNRWNILPKKLSKKKMQVQYGPERISIPGTQMQLFELQCSTPFAICIKLHWNR